MSGRSDRLVTGTARLDGNPWAVPQHGGDACVRVFGGVLNQRNVDDCALFNVPLTDEGDKRHGQRAGSRRKLSWRHRWGKDYG